MPADFASINCVTKLRLDKKSEIKGLRILSVIIYVGLWLLSYKEFIMPCE